MNRAHRIAFLVLVLLPIAIQLPSLTGIFDADPMLRYSGLGYGLERGILPGLPLIDPSIGFFHQALGQLAASEVLHGGCRFWNPYEAAGVPLLGEMNASPFYPLMPVLLLPRGQVVMEILVQILSGVATFGVLRSLGLGVLPALTGGLLFEFNGTMAWLGGGWNYPSPCLPFLIYGIEKLRSARMHTRAIAVAVMALAIAISISAGFIEIAFLNGLLGVVWALFRLVRAPRSEPYAIGLALAAVAGLLLASPILIAFADYLRVGTAGGNHSGAISSAHLSLIGLLQKFFPYIWGPIFLFGARIVPWGDTGGYLGFAIPIVAVAALFGTKDRGLRYLLVTWIVITMGATVGVVPFQRLLQLIPGVSFTASYRYLDMSCAFALAVLVAFCIDDAKTLIWVDLRRRLLAGAGALVVIVLGSFWASASWVADLTTQPQAYEWFVFALAAAYIFSAATILSARATTASKRALFVGGAVVVEALVAFIVPTLSTPLGGSIDLGGVAFLRAHLGVARYYSLGPLAPNYSAMFRLASIDYNDVPMPNAWLDYVQRDLDPYGTPLIFNGTFPRSTPGLPDQFTELTKNLTNYENAGVKYVVTVASVAPDVIPTSRLVYRDSLMSIFELPHVAPYVSAPHCTLTTESRLEIRGTCTAPSTVQRLELYMPGWTATVNDRPTSVTPRNGTFQEVNVPSGNVDVRFSFVPPYMTLGYAGFAFGIVLLGSLIIVAYRLERRSAPTPQVAG